jgi:hypothetical protein
MNEPVSTSARAKTARRNYIVFCGAATIVMAVLLLATVALLGGD